MTRPTLNAPLFALAALLALPLAAAQSEVSIWFHASGASPVYEEQVRRFNESQSDYRAVITEIPGGAVSGCRSRRNPH